MGIIPFLKPKWQHPDPLVRIKAIENIDNAEIDTLCQIILHDDDSGVRFAALNQIDAPDIIMSLAGKDCEPDIKNAILEKRDNILVNNVLSAKDVESRNTALGSIYNENILLRIAISDVDVDLKCQVVNKINEQAILARLLKENCGKTAALLAVEKISDPQILQSISQEASNRAARAKANQKLEELNLSLNQPTPEQILHEKVNDLILKADKLANSHIFEEDIDTYAAIKAAFIDCTLPNEHPDFKMFMGFDHIISSKINTYLKEKHLREEKEQFFSEQYEKLVNIIELIVKLRLSLSLETDGKFYELQKEWDQIISELDHQISKNLLDRYLQVCRNYSEARKVIVVEQEEEAAFVVLLDKIDDLLAQKKYNKAYKNIKRVQESITDWQPKFVDRDKLAERLVLQLQRQDLEKSTLKDRQENALQENLNNRSALLAEITGALTVQYSDELAERVNEIKTILLKPVGLPPGNEDFDQNILAAIEEFYDKQRDFYKEKDWGAWQNKVLKEELIQKVQSLSDSNDLHKVFKEIKESQARWKEIGSAPQKNENKLWRDFKKLTDDQFARCQVFFQQLEDEANRNYEKKMELCQQAKDHQESIEWQKNALFLKDLQEQWKKIGRAPKGKNDEIYSTFRKACNHFFDQRKEHYIALDKQRDENLEQKTKLCELVEEIVENPELSSKKKIRDIQNSWKTIGRVPKEHDESIWKRFRTACDSYYVWLDSLKPENLKEKEALCAEVEAIVGGLTGKVIFNEVTPKITNLQRKWKSIGPVPEVEKDSIWKRFQKACNFYFDIKRKHFNAIDAKRPENQKQKNEIIKRIKELVQFDTKESAREIISLQEKWKTIGPATKELERKLSSKFEDLCNTFFTERRHAYEEMDIMRRQNLKEKESLCLRLEIVAGISHKPKRKAEKNNSLTLAEQLKVAFESNFVLSGEDQNKSRRAKDEVQLVQDEWGKIGEVPREHEHFVKNRYQKALRAAKKKQ